MNLTLKDTKKEEAVRWHHQYRIISRSYLRLFSLLVSTSEISNKIDNKGEDKDEIEDGEKSKHEPKV